MCIIFLHFTNSLTTLCTNLDIKLKVKCLKYQNIFVTHCRLYLLILKKRKKCWLLSAKEPVKKLYLFVKKLETHQTKGEHTQLLQITTKQVLFHVFILQTSKPRGPLRYIVVHMKKKKGGVYFSIKNMQSRKCVEGSKMQFFRKKGVVCQKLLKFFRLKPI